LSLSCQRLVQILENDTGVAHHQLILRRDRPDPVHAAQRQEDRLTAGIGSRTSYHAAIASLRYDGDRIFIRNPDNGSSLLRVRRRNHGSRRARIAAAPVGQPWRHIIAGSGKALRPYGRSHFFQPFCCIGHISDSCLMVITVRRFATWKELGRQTLSIG